MLAGIFLTFFPDVPPAALSWARTNIPAATGSLIKTKSTLKKKKKVLSFPPAIWSSSLNQSCSLRPSYCVIIAATIATFIFLLVLLFLLYPPGFQRGNLWQCCFFFQKTSYKGTFTSRNSQWFGCSLVKFADEENSRHFLPHCGFPPTERASYS